MLEEELRQSIMKKVEEKVNGHEGTWIDWQHLHRAATLLTKCRYTLQYTYPYAYYMESGSKKELVWFSIEAFVRVEFETSEIKVLLEYPLNRSFKIKLLGLKPPG